MSELVFARPPIDASGQFTAWAVAHACLLWGGAIVLSLRRCV
jgi:hypothetical protein